MSQRLTLVYLAKYFKFLSKSDEMMMVTINFLHNNLSWITFVAMLIQSSLSPKLIKAETFNFTLLLSMETKRMKYATHVINK